MRPVGAEWREELKEGGLVDGGIGDDWQEKI
jgi:hypothetical protein